MCLFESALVEFDRFDLAPSIERIGERGPTELEMADGYDATEAFSAVLSSEGSAM